MHETEKILQFWVKYFRRAWHVIPAQDVKHRQRVGCIIEQAKQCENNSHQEYKTPRNKNQREPGTSWKIKPHNDRRAICVTYARDKVWESSAVRRSWSMERNAGTKDTVYFPTSLPPINHPANKTAVPTLCSPTIPPRVSRNETEYSTGYVVIGIIGVGKSHTNEWKERSRLSGDSRPGSSQ